MKGKLCSSQNGVEVEEQIKLSDHKWHVSSLGFSINGVYFASGSWDKQVRVWDLRVLTTSKALGGEDKGHKAPVTSVSWFPKVEFLLASGSADNTVRIWNSESGERLSVLEEHSEWILGTSFNFSGTVLASASWDKSIGIWDINTLKLSQLLQGHNGGVWRAEFRTQDGDNIICSASEDSSVKIWDLRTQSKWLHVSNLVGIHDDAVKCCAWSPCGNYIAAGSLDTRISIWDIRENRAINLLQGHTDMVTEVKFLPQETSVGHQVLVSAGGTTCRFWDTLSQEKAKQLLSLNQHDLDYEVECLELSGDGTLLATGGRDNKIVLSTVNINEEELHKFSRIQKSLSQKEHAFNRSAGVSVNSSAILVDNTVQQNKLLENKKAKQIAKQTVKIKSTGGANILQTKIMELKSKRGLAQPDEKTLKESREQVPSSTTDKRQVSAPSNKRQSSTTHPERDYLVTIVQSSEQQEKKSGDQAGEYKAVHRQIPPSINPQKGQEFHENSHSLYQSGLILNSVKYLPTSFEEPSTIGSARHGSQTTLDSSYDIDDVANELIRLSEEQQSYDAQL